MTEQKITVTLNQESPFKRVLMRAEDTARELLVYIVGTDGTALDMSGMMAEFRAKKPDNTEIARTKGVTIEGDYVRVAITANTIAAAGIVSCEVLLYFNGVEIGTAPFDIEVWEARVRDSSLNSNSDFQSAIAAAAAAQAAADRAESFTSHPNIVLNNGNWGVWNGSEYEDSGVRAVAQDGRVYEVHAGTNVNVDNTDPTNPIVSSVLPPGAIMGIVPGMGIDVDDTDPFNPILSAVGTITVYTHTKTGTVHALSNNKGNDNIKFVATTDYEDGDTFEVNSTAITIINGTPSFMTGETVMVFLDGATLNFKSGGGVSNINYEVIGGTTQPEGKENRFWVNTSEPIPNYGILDAVPNGDTLCPWGDWAKGDVLIICNGQLFPFVAYKGGSGGTFSPAAAYQYNGANWVRAALMMYVDGVWKPIRDYIFYKGTEYLQLAFIAPSTGTAENSGTDIYMYGAASSTGTMYAHAYTQDSIDLTNIDRIKINITQSTGSTPSALYERQIYACAVSYTPTRSNHATAAAQYKFDATVTGVVELDVSQLTGRYRLGLCMPGHTQYPNTINIDEWWHE